ncbi:MAG: xylose isomerase [Flavobacteriaceae bacterium]|nr:MAG: xylose isomerase [Flavobacteriaceae bacterium]
MNRRNVLKSTLATGAAFALGSPSLLAASKRSSKKHNFTFCLNTSTIRKQNLGLMRELDMAAQAGFDGIEIWMNTLQTYLKSGGKASDVRKKSEDLGLIIEDSIGFAAWVVDDEVQRNKAMEQVKQEMDVLAQIGCKRIAAPPMGATNEAGLDLLKAAERYGKMCTLGKEMGVLPQLELWGFSKNLHLFGETLFVAAECGHSDAVILPDVYHLRRGGSPFEALEMINGSKIQMFHINDYPGAIAKEQLTDDMRVMPGDGEAPMDSILQTLNNKGVPIALSLEIFNEDVWEMDALDACKLGISKMKTCVDSAVR